MSDEGIDWGSLDFSSVEAEFATDPRDEVARAAGVPIWAWGLYQEMQEARQDHEDNCEDPNGCGAPSEEEAAERFVDEFVRPLAKGAVRVAWDGGKEMTPSDLRGTATIELNGKGLFTLYMALKVASGVLEQMGPLALIGGGLNPNLQDATEAAQLARALSTGVMSVACAKEGDDFVGTDFDATQS